jgi:galactokinase
MPQRVTAFAPGRINVIGEHTDYNDGLCLPFAIRLGVKVTAEPVPGRAIEAHALDLGEEDRFEPGAETRPDAPTGWRRFLRGAAAELSRAGVELRPSRLEITGNVPRDAGLSSSAALCVSVCLALCAASGARAPARVELARLCSRVENDWVGAQTGLLDQLASLFGEPGSALRIDLRGPNVRPVPLALGDHRLVTLASGASRRLAGSGYNERREECRLACRALGVRSLRDADADAPSRLPEPLSRRVRHVVSENRRVEEAVEALERAHPAELGRLLDASHASLRDDYEVSVTEVERARDACKRAGAAGVRMVGGGFGGSVLALFPPEAEPPAGAFDVEPGAGARVLDRT